MKAKKSRVQTIIATRTAKLNTLNDSTPYTSESNLKTGIRAEGAEAREYPDSDRNGGTKKSPTSDSDS